MEIIKKHGIKILCAIALIALFLPMASITVGSDYADYENTTNISGFTVAFQGYICMLLIVGPVAIVAADYIAIVKRLRALVQAGVSVLGVILTFVGYLQANNIAAAGDAGGMGFVDVEASLGFGGILCIIAYVGILAITLLFQKDELIENINALKGTSK